MLGWWTASTDQADPVDSSGVSRRKFLGGLGGAAAATMAAGVVGFEPLLNANSTAEAANSTSAAANRRNAACQMRKGMADYWKAKGMVAHPVNGDESLYPSRIANYSKSLPHNSLGEVDPAAYNSFLAAIASDNPADYDAIIINPGAIKLTSPQCGLAFDMEGIDSHAVAVPAPPRFDSREHAGEIVENYWEALLRDTNFLDYGSSAAAQAVADLNAFGADFKGPKAGGQVTIDTLFRDIAPGTTVGPYISQFMWLPTPFGVEYVERKMWTLAPGSDHMQTFPNWLAAQNGFVPEPRPSSGLGATSSTAATSPSGSTSTSSSRPTSTPA